MLANPVGEVSAMTEIADLFADLEDPRAVNARRHSLRDILVIALCTVICGSQTCTDMELFGHSSAIPRRSFCNPF